MVGHAAGPISTRPNTGTKAALRAGLMPILEEMTQRGARCEPRSPTDHLD
jgi:hypothetical protein